MTKHSNDEYELRSDLYGYLLAQAEAWLFQFELKICRNCGHFEDFHSSGQQCCVPGKELDDWCFCSGIDYLIEGMLNAPSYELTKVINPDDFNIMVKLIKDEIK